MDRFVTDHLRLAPSAAALCLALACLALPALAQVQVDPQLPVYKPVQGVSGTVKSIGSDTMNNLMTLWTEGFKTFYPNVTVAIEGKGSSTAPPALIAGTADYGPMSRPMKQAELDEFEKAFGYKPTPLSAAIDMLAVFVHKDNPLQGLTLKQVDAVFSATRNRGLTADLRTWGDLGLTGAWAQQPISLYGRNSASGTYGFFKEHVLAKGDYKASVKEQPGSSAVVGAVAGDKFAMGYSGIGYKTADVRALPLASEQGEPFVPAEPAHAYTGDYPLSRFLYLYVNYKPGAQLDPLRAEFVKFVFSKQGQEVVVKDGFYPVTAEMARGALRSAGLTPNF